MFYAVASAPGQLLSPDFLMIDPLTGAATVIASSVAGVGALEADAGGTLWAWVGNVGLATIDPLTGVLTQVGPTNFNQVGTLAFSRSGALHGAGGPGFYRIDTGSGAVTPISAPAPHAIRSMAFFPDVALEIRGASVPTGWAIDVDLRGGLPGSSYITFLTFNAGAFPGGALFGVDPLPGELLLELTTPGAPFNGSLDAGGAAAYRLTLAAPVGAMLYGVSFEHAGGMIISISDPVAGSI